MTSYHLPYLEQYFKKEIDTFVAKVSPCLDLDLTESEVTRPASLVLTGCCSVTIETIIPEVTIHGVTSCGPRGYFF